MLLQFGQISNRNTKLLPLTLNQHNTSMSGKKNKEEWTLMARKNTVIAKRQKSPILAKQPSPHMNHRPKRFKRPQNQWGEWNTSSPTIPIVLKSGSPVQPLPVLLERRNINTTKTGATFVKPLLSHQSSSSSVAHKARAIDDEFTISRGSPSQWGKWRTSPTLPIDGQNLSTYLRRRYRVLRVGKEIRWIRNKRPLTLRCCAIVPSLSLVTIVTAATPVTPATLVTPATPATLATLTTLATLVPRPPWLP